MNSNRSYNDSDVDEQASLWAARLDDRALSAADRAELETWLGANPAHRARLDSYLELGVDLDGLLPALVSAGSTSMPAEAQPARRRFRLPLFLGLGLAAAASVALAVRFVQPGGFHKVYATAVAERRVVDDLPDGSRIQLNARTSMTVDFSRSERHIRLDLGEAFFEVSKNPSRPFIVETPAGTVRVTGTKFNVLSAAQTDIEVTVVEGSVQVRQKSDGGPGAPDNLVAGDRWSAGVRGVSHKKLSTDELRSSLAWREGRLSDKTSLRDVLAQLGRFHGRTIAVTDAAGSRFVAGSWSLEDKFDNTLSSIGDSMSVAVKRDANGNYRVTLPDEP